MHYRRTLNTTASQAIRLPRRRRRRDFSPFSSVFYSPIVLFFQLGGRNATESSLGAGATAVRQSIRETLKNRHGKTGPITIKQPGSEPVLHRQSGKAVPMKVALYSHSFPPEIDGVSRRFSSIVHELYKAGHEVVIFTLERAPQLEAAIFPRGGPAAPRFRYVTLDSKFHDLYPSKRVASPTPRNLGLVLAALRREKPDALHVTVDAMTLVFALAAALTGVPCVGSIHTDVQTALRSVNASPWALFLANFKEQMESRLLDGCATTSPSFRAKLRQQGVGCDHVVQTAVLVDKFRPAARCSATRRALTFGHPDAFLVVYVGRLAPEKGLDTLITVAQSVDNLYLAIVGDGPLGGYLASLHGAANRVYCRPGFLSHDDLPRMYASADAHVTCSLFETLGNTVLEAHACGIPVVVPRTQGFIDTVTDGNASAASADCTGGGGFAGDSGAGSGDAGAEDCGDGFLFAPDRPADMARLLERLRDDCARRRRMGARGREKVLRQSPALVTGDIVEWYGRAVARRNAAAPFAKFCRGLQLTGMVLLLVVVWHIYCLPTAVARSLGRANRVARALVGRSASKLRAAAARSGFFRRIGNTYRTLNVTAGEITGPARRRDAR
ncbi:unnamed protein product [Phaeothamnion confervicola]